MRSAKKKKSKRSKRLLSTLLIIFAVLLVWQSIEYVKLKTLLVDDSSYAVGEYIPQELQETIIGNRNALLKSVDQNSLSDLKDEIVITDINKPEDSDFAKTALNSTQGDATKPEFISLEQARGDVEFLEKYYKYSFGGYEYYGGDDAFSPVFQNIIFELEQIENSQDTISVEDFSLILKDNLLPLLGDLHCWIEGENQTDYLNNKYYNYSSEELLFSKEEGVFSTEIQGETFVLNSVNNYEIENIMKPTITANVDIFYIPWVIIDTESDNIPLTLNVRNEDEEKAVIVTLQKATQYSGDEIYNSPYYFKEEDSYTYVRNSSLMPDFDAYKSDMMRDARNLNDNPIVLDLRNNGGGNSLYCVEWIFNYINVSKVQVLNLPFPTLSYELRTNTISTLQKNKLKLNREPEFKQRIGGYGELLHIKNDRPIFVLMDRGNGSSGEWWLTYLARMDNVVFIGENSSGVQIGGNNTYTKLPYSRIRVSASTQVAFENDLEYRERYGISPDIYLFPDVALERVILFVENFNKE